MSDQEREHQYRQIELEEALEDTPSYGQMEEVIKLLKEIVFIKFVL